MRLFGKVCVISVACLLGAGCGEKDDEEAAKGELEGTWDQTCGSDDPATSTKRDFDVTTVVFTATDFTYTSTQYGSDSTCATKSITLKLSGTYKGGDAVTTPAGAKALDLTPVGLALTLHSDEEVSNFNEGSVCGGGWVKDTEKVVTKEACAGVDEIVATFDPQFTIYKVDGTNLYMGDSTASEAAGKDGKTAANRENVLETRAAVKK